ncbi:MAG: NAD(P)/FAD-dependent oxidoreductase [Alphaproteobacteria bacterium]|nr:NAD(P)/FAD-dependent oxidoreductase [Alphaproteobacteria bacterium]
MIYFDVIIIGGGAAGLMAAARSGSKGNSVLLIDHAEKIGEKIRISGGGRCNFTNLHTSPAHFISTNPHFCKSALSRYTPKDFLTLIEKHHIAYHDKGRGQLFCDDKATQIVDMLLNECKDSNVTFWTGTSVDGIDRTDDGHFQTNTKRGSVGCRSLVIATGGLSIPKIGATGFGYKIANQFGHQVVPTRPGLVPLTFTDETSKLCAELTGLSVDPAIVSTGKTKFEEALLFTHRGLSGPSILQISSYWRETESIAVNLVPDLTAFDWLKEKRKSDPKKMLRTVIEDVLPNRLANALATLSGHDGQMANLPDKKLAAVADLMNKWTLVPAGTEGYRTAEVTLGGVDTTQISSKTFESQLVSGLYFIGEVLDVTGHLGGFNFQWAWASGWCCGESLATQNKDQEPEKTIRDITG